MSKSGIIITLIGIGVFLISIFASEGYDQRRSIMGNMYSMEVVIYGGRVVYPVYPSSDTPGSQAERLSKYSSPSIEGRLSIPLRYLLSLSTVITLVGIGKILLSKKQK